MFMRQLNAVLSAKNEFQSHRDFPLIGTFDHRANFPLIVIKKFHSKGYIGELIVHLSIVSDRNQSAVAPLLTDFIITLGPLTAVSIIGGKTNESSDNQTIYRQL